MGEWGHRCNKNVCACMCSMYEKYKRAKSSSAILQRKNIKMLQMQACVIWKYGDTYQKKQLKYLKVVNSEEWKKKIRKDCFLL